MKIGFIASAFDLLHPGHLLILEDAQNNCDHLIAALHSDPSIDRPGVKNKPLESLFDRYMRLKYALGDFPSDIVPYDTEEDLYNMIITMKPDIRFLGHEYKDSQFTGKNLDIQIKFVERLHKWSSSALRNKLKD